jgi:hypothetical protein
MPGAYLGHRQKGTTHMTDGTGTGPGRPHGAYVDVDELARTLDKTRVLRLALNVLYDDLPDRVTRGSVEDALVKVHDHLTKEETTALTAFGFAEHYVVIRPFSPLGLPEPQAVKEITSAIRTLYRHGMLVQAPDARARDDG